MPSARWLPVPEARVQTDWSSLGGTGLSGSAVSLPLPHRTHTYGQMQGNEGRHPNTWGGV